MIRELTDAEVARMPAAERERLHDQFLLRQAKDLYQRYGQPLEQEHRGRFVAIARDGRTLLGKTTFDVL